MDAINQITVGQIIAIILAIAGLITAIGVIMKKIGDWAQNWLAKGLLPVYKKLDAISEKVDRNELETDKTTLVRFLADIKNGETLTDIEMERLHETYNRYTSQGGNSYIHSEFEKLSKEGKL